MRVRHLKNIQYTYHVKEPTVVEIIPKNNISVENGSVTKQIRPPSPVKPAKTSWAQKHWQQK